MNFPMFDLVVKEVKVNLRSLFEQILGINRVPDTTYQISRPSVYWFWRRILLNVLSYMGMVAMLVMGPGLCEQILVHSAQGGPK